MSVIESLLERNRTFASSRFSADLESIPSRLDTRLDELTFPSP